MDYTKAISTQESILAVSTGSSLLVGALSVGTAIATANPLPLLGILGMLTGGIAGHSSAKSDGLKQAEKSAREFQGKLTQKDEEIFHLQQKLKEYRHECDILGERLKAYEGELNTQIKAYADVVAERNICIQERGTESEESKAAIARAEAECLRLETLVENLRTGTKERQKRAFRVAKKKIGDAVALAIYEREQELRGEYQEIVERVAEQGNDQILQAQKIIDKLNFNIELLERKVTFWEAQAKLHMEATGRMDFFQGKTPQEIRGNIVIQQLKASEVNVFKPELKAIVGGFQYTFDYRGAFEDSALKSARVLIQRDLGDELPPEISVADHKVKVVLWHSREHKPVKDLLKGISDYSWLPAWFGDGVHFQVMAETGSGKSTFLNNFLGWIEQQNLGADFTISDTKGDPVAWNGRRVDHVGVSGSARHFSSFKDLMESRLGTHRRETMEGMQPTVFRPHFGIFDEYELYLNESAREDEESAKVESKAFRSILIAGRSPKTRMIFVSQSPNCSRLGLQNADLNNVARIVVGARTIKYLLQSRGREVFGNQLDTVQQQFDLWRARAKKSDNPKWRHFGCVDLDGDWTFVLLPPPSHFTSTSIAQAQAKPATLAPNLEQQALGICPDCRHESHRWHTRGKVLRCQNKECSRKTFSISKSLPVA